MLIVVVTLHSLVDWPLDVAPTLLAATRLVPLGLAASAPPPRSTRRPSAGPSCSRPRHRRDRGRAYLLAVRGFDKAPTTRSARDLLWWAMAAAAFAAVAQLALRGRFTRIATSLTYGAREAPDEVVRSFGSRMTRAIPMDELLLQLVESLRKTLTLASARDLHRQRRGTSSSRSRCPTAQATRFASSRDERAVIARAGVSGNAWASVWLPSHRHERRWPVRFASRRSVTPVNSSASSSSARADGAVAFREEDDRVLADLARQVGLALHNAQLDTALQSSLDELRRQADELRASRARVVASGDAERRRVERNLHDGAQQHLVALAVNLRLTKDVVARTPRRRRRCSTTSASRSKRRSKSCANSRTASIRRCSSTAVSVEALRAVANRSPLDVELITEGIGRYGGDVEAAVYFCCPRSAAERGQARAPARTWWCASGRSRAACSSRFATTARALTCASPSADTATST